MEVDFPVSCLHTSRSRTPFPHVRPELGDIQRAGHLFTTASTPIQTRRRTHRVSAQVELANALLALVSWHMVPSAVHTNSGRVIVGYEAPALGAQEAVDDMHGQQLGVLVQTLELANDRGAVSPWADVRDDEVVAAWKGRTY